MNLLRDILLSSGFVANITGFFYYKMGRGLRNTLATSALKACENSNDVINRDV